MAAGTPYPLIKPGAVAVLQGYDWPGNIGQLRNNVERIIIMASGDTGSPINAAMLTAEVNDSGTLLTEKEKGERMMNLSLREARQAFKRESLLAQMRRLENNVSRTARFIGMESSALYQKIKMLGAPVHTTSDPRS